ncbi:MAG: histidinol dehydrogenase [Alloprevotella sp.]|nr:histidinol dehydrogenase [Alloprevotella sp.]
MKTYLNPPRSLWAEICCRPAFDLSALYATVQPIMEAVRTRGDEALLELEARFDHCQLTSLAVSEEALRSAEAEIDVTLAQSIQLAADNIRRFHAAQCFQPIRVQTTVGVTAWQRSVPIERVGLYVPGGTAPLLSTVLMLAIPAQVAGCKQVVLCTPPSPQGRVHPAIRYAATLCGIHNIYMCGGAGAIAAMAYGTPTVPKVDKIFGPGNQYVMAAKQLASLADVAIDMPAGPSEVLVVADASARPDFVAADLLSQAEHGPDSQVVLLATDEALMHAVAAKVERQLAQLPRRDIAAKALDASSLVFLPSLDDALALAEAYAPEHLILALSHPHAAAERITRAGSVFLGHYACESAGDYASGPNHTLPTRGYAAAYSGLSLDSFCRKMTLQEITADGVRAIGPAVCAMAHAEQLSAHAQAMQLRLDTLPA